MAQYSQAPVALVIPAYAPPASLPAFVRQLTAAMQALVIVVNDGSPTEQAPLFAELAAIPMCTVLTHTRNQGKGAALKTAFSHILHHLPQVRAILTVDADGQHALADCQKVLAALKPKDVSAVLGVRTFSLHTTPFRSWWGNRWTTLAFLARYGHWIGDTQTGLRAFRRALIPLLLAVPGTDYAYEMAVLCTLVRRAISFATVPIQTLYSAGNATSHYDPLRDTVRVLSTLFNPPTVVLTKGLYT